MYVCICSAVNDTTIRAAVVGGQTNFKALCRELNIVRTCGKCALCARNVFEQAKQKTGSAGGNMP